MPKIAAKQATETNKEAVTRLQAAKTKILDLDDPEYIKAHTYSLTRPRHMRVKFGDQEVELVGAAHTQNPESAMIKAVVGYVKNYLKRVSAEKQLIMVEGFHHAKPYAESTFVKSVRLGGEPHAVTFLAQKAGVVVISPEAPIKLVNQKCIAMGMTKEEILLFYAIQNIPGFVRMGYGAGRAAAGAAWEAGYISIDEVEQNRAESEKTALDLVNHAAHKALGQAFASPKGEILLNEQQIYDLTEPSMQKKVTNRISAISGDVRDEYIIDEIDKSVRKKKSPLLVYGASHIVRLKPAIKFLYGGGFYSPR